MHDAAKACGHGPGPVLRHPKDLRKANPTESWTAWLNRYAGRSLRRISKDEMIQRYLVGEAEIGRRIMAPDRDYADADTDPVIIRNMSIVAIANRLCDRFDVVMVADTKPPDSLAIDSRIDVVELPPPGLHRRSSATSRNGSSKATFRQSDIARRSSILLERYSRIKPDVILIEEYPIGENQLCGSLLPMLERVRVGVPSSPLVVGSLSHFCLDPWNDNRARDDRAADILSDYFDALLVHSDSGFARRPLSTTPASSPRKLPGEDRRHSVSGTLSCHWPAMLKTTVCAVLPLTRIDFCGTSNRSR